MTDELKPCQKCGREPTILSDYWDTFGDYWHYWVQCPVCLGPIPLYGHPTSEDAITAWNRRAPEGQDREASDD